MFSFCFEGLLTDRLYRKLEHTASPVVQGAVVRILVIIMTVTNCEGRQCDVSVAFLRAKLKEKLYMWPGLAY